MNLEFESERLSYTPLTSDDLDIALALFTDEAVTRYVCDVHTPAQVKQSMADSVRRGGDGCIGIWCVRRQDNGEKIGTTVILPMPIEHIDTEWELVVPGQWPSVDLEIGYLLRRSAWGRGYATEIGHRILRFAFEETPLEEVVAVTDPDNHASKRVLTKIGMRAEGTRRAYASDCCAFRLNRAQWLSQRNRGAGGTDPGANAKPGA